MRAGTLSLIAATSTVAIVASLATAPTAQAAASIYNSGSQCIGATPAGWTSAAVLPGDRAIVWSPPALHAEAVDIAHEVRAKAIIAGYESKLSIAAIGFPGQPGPFPIYVDPNFHTASPGAEGIFARRLRPAWSEDPSAETGGTRQRRRGRPRDWATRHRWVLVTTSLTIPSSRWTPSSGSPKARPHINTALGPLWPGCIVAGCWVTRASSRAFTM